MAVFVALEVDFTVSFVFGVFSDAVADFDPASAFCVVAVDGLVVDAAVFSFLSSTFVPTGSVFSAFGVSFTGSDFVSTFGFPAAGVAVAGLDSDVVVVGGVALEVTVGFAADDAVDAAVDFGTLISSVDAFGVAVAVALSGAFAVTTLLAVVDEGDVEVVACDVCVSAGVADWVTFG